MSRTRRPSPRAATLLVALLLAPAAAFAAQLIVNGVPIGKVDLTVAGLEGITFEKCSWVKIESNGNVAVDCPGYDLQSAAPPAEAPKPVDAPAKITKRYWLVTEQKEKGSTQFDIDLYVNAKWVKRFKNDDEQVVMELTKHLVPGKNKLLFAATKNLAEPRKSESPSIFYRFVVGEGDVNAGNVMIDVPIIDMKRTAAEGENITEERELVTR